MDRRGRLAQSITANAQWLAAPRSGFARVKRMARRLLAPVLELDIPHGPGSIAAAMIVAASVGYGISAGGHGPDILAELQRACDAVSNRAGLQISSIALSGQRELGQAAVLDLAGVGSQSSLPCLDAATARRSLMRNPWIADATVLKLYPGRLQISITERVPLALWQKDGRVSVIAADGTVLEDFNGSRFMDLPLVVGDGAERQARDFLDMLGRYPLIRQAVEASVYVAERRWNLRLKNGIDVRLPDSDVEQALQTLVALDRDKKILSRDITAIDLRMPTQVTVQLSDAAAQARAEAVKEMLKKPKTKEHDA
jgi:cell division protein FtsQ